MRCLQVLLQVPERFLSLERQVGPSLALSFWLSLGADAQYSTRAFLTMYLGSSLVSYPVPYQLLVTRLTKKLRTDSFIEPRLGMIMWASFLMQSLRQNTPHLPHDVGFGCDTLHRNIDQLLTVRNYLAQMQIEITQDR
jgi:hypothetical protein